MPSRKGNYSWKGVRDNDGPNKDWDEFDEDRPPVQDINPVDIVNNFPKKTKESISAFNYEIVNIESSVLLERNNI